MYDRLGRRGVVKYPAGAHVRLEADTASRRADAFLRRHERAATEAIRRGRAGLQEIGPDLHRRIANTSNLLAAWDYLKRRGGQAPGPNGLRYEDLEHSEVWSLLRTITSAILDDSYRHGPDRKVRIPKSSGEGHRTLSLENIEDRVVARAVVQVIQPLLDPTYLRRTTNNRAELLAVIRGLELLPKSAVIRLVTDSRYVAFGLTEGIEIWKAQGWRTGRPGRRKDLRNKDLWQRLDALLSVRRVICEPTRPGPQKSGARRWL